MTDHPRSNAPTMPLPPLRHTAAGAERRIGVELEFSGLDLARISRTLAGTIGGTVEEISRYETRVRDTTLGDFAVELDFAFLKKAGRARGIRAPEAGFDLTALPEEILAAVAEQVVPYEVVSPPIPMARLAELEPVISRLRAAGALGTRHSPVYAYGLHLNPELPAVDAATVLAYFRAFLCLYDWLARESEVDWSRRATPYVRAFPGAFVRQVMAPDYAPDLAAFADDYLAAIPDRNRALDMLPVLVEVDEAKVRAAVDDPRVKGRPALHYRLPNCDIDAAGWSLAEPWRDWLQVEHLASDRERLAGASRAFLHHLERPLGGLAHDWATECEQWLVSRARIEEEGA